MADFGANVKIIEQDYAVCRTLAEALPNVTIIHGDGTDHQLLSQEGMEDMDAVAYPHRPGRAEHPDEPVRRSGVQGQDHHQDHPGLLRGHCGKHGCGQRVLSPIHCRRSRGAIRPRHGQFHRLQRRDSVQHCRGQSGSPGISCFSRKPGLRRPASGLAYPPRHSHRIHPSGRPGVHPPGSGHH
ncbi:MAG: NAD-binding protein [Oscillospiraceae bacterium]